MVRTAQAAVLAALSAALAVRSAAAQREPRPAPVMDVTAGGLHVWDFPDQTDAPGFAMAVFVDIGADDDGPHQRGLASLLAHVLFESPPEAPSGGWPAGVERSLEVARGGLVFRISGPAGVWRDMVDWLAERLVRVHWSELPLEAAQRAAIARAGERSADDVVGLLYDRSPTSSPSDVATSLAGITRADLRALHDRRFCARNMFVGFSGRVPRDDCMRKIVAAFAALPGGQRRPVAPARSRSGTMTLPRAADADGPWRLYRGFHLDLGSPQQLACAMVMSQYLQRRLHVVTTVTRKLALTAEVELAQQRGAERLELRATARKPNEILTLDDCVDDVVDELGAPDPGLLAAVVDDVPQWFCCSSPHDVGDVLRLCAAITRRDGTVEDFTAAASGLLDRDVAAAASDWLRADNRYRLSDVEPVEPDYSWSIVFVALLTLVAAQRLRGRRAVERTAERRDPRRRAPVTVSAAAEELEREFQRYFAEEDRSRDER